MISQLLVVTIGVLSVPLTHCRAEQVSSLHDAQATLAALIHDIDANRIEEIEVFHIPTSVRRFAAVTPEGIRREYYYRLVIKQTGVAALTPSLLTALRHTSLKKITTPSDIRWGVIFKLAQGVRREIYVGRTGRTGNIDGLEVEFGGGLPEWVQRLTATLP